MYQLKFFVAAILIIITNSANADLFNIQLSNDSGRFTYAAEMYGGQYGPVDFETSLFFDQDNDKIFDLGMVVHNDTLDNPLIISVGARAYYGDVGNAPDETHATFAAIAVGGELLFIPGNLGGLGFGVYYYIAPSVVTFMDADKYNEYGARLTYSVTKQADVSLGYQKIETKLNNGTTLDVDSSAFFAITLRF